MQTRAIRSDDGGEGTLYGRAPQTHDAELCEVGAGTPCGEFMRRYWLPVYLSENVTTRPVKVRVLGEDLILFRDGRGRPGLLYPRCAHRGTTLYYGKVDEDGIRCCYHGWQYDVEGRCLDQPCEPASEKTSGLHKDKVRQPWYPLEERYGLVFAYMGPPAKRPVLPRWDILENPGADEKIYASATSGFKAGPEAPLETLPCNWLQDYENIMDPFHVPILHMSHAGRGGIFDPKFAIMPKVTFEYAELGVQYSAHRTLEDGTLLDRVSVGMFPCVQSVPDGGSLKAGRSNHMIWRVPVDDTHVCHFAALRVPKDYEGRVRTGTEKLWAEMTEEEHQRFPMDYEAQVGQGPITLRSEEHLATSDKGIVMLRRLLKEQIRTVQAGGDPLGVSFDPAKALCRVAAGNFYRKAGTQARGEVA
jgi:phenylpropionate dioxygenase-like ring-hydroxylating dioxygenase large terminal subunit